MKTAAIYARVSTADQVKGTSLDGQVQLCQEYAKEHGYTVIKVLQEDASGARLDRPKLGELRDMAARHEIEALIVFDPDRLSRSLAHTMLLVEEFERARAGVLFVNAPREDTPEGKMLFGMKALFAEYERTKIMERTRRGKERRAKEGKVFIAKNLPYGYTMAKGEGQLTLVESEAVWVRHMYEWLLNDYASLGEIKRRLQAAGVPTKHGAVNWSRSTIHHILSSELYTGTWHYNKSAGVLAANPRFERNRGKKSYREAKPRSEWIPVPVPAIISDNVHQAALIQLTANSENSPRNKKHDYLLTGIFFCSYCNCTMHGHFHCKGMSSVYRCRSRTRATHLPLAERCPGRSYSGANMERIVWQEVTRQFSDPALIESKLREHASQRSEDRQRDERDLASLYELELPLKRDADKLLDYLMSDLITRETYQERMEVITAKQDALSAGKAEIVRRMEASRRAQPTPQDIEALCKRVQKGLPHLEYADKRAFLKALSVRVEAIGPQIRITGRMTDALLSVSNASTDDHTPGEDGVLCPSYLDGRVEQGI